MASGKEVASARIVQFIQDFSADISDLDQFYNITISSTRLKRLQEFFSEQLEELQHIPFEQIHQEGQVDWLLAKGFLQRRLRQVNNEIERGAKLKPYLGDWGPALIQLCESRQKVANVDGQSTARVLSDVVSSLQRSCKDIESGKIKSADAEARQAAYRAAQAVDELLRHMQEWFDFYNGYDPVLSWWVRHPWAQLPDCMIRYASLLREKLVGDADEDAIVGQPVGREGLLTELKAEVIAYSPEELINIGEREYAWCENEIKKAAKDLGFSDWRAAQEHVRNTYVEPGRQPAMVCDLAHEAVDYILKRDMITVPRIANECWRTSMMAPARQKVNPFFLGGEQIIVSYPTDTMDHADKLMSMRGNNPPFSRSTVQHELVPGHHLQFYYMDRWRPYRKVFDTPFWIEGWAFYWEFILWDRGFPGQTGQKHARNEAENKIGMLFWRMHRCIRIIFSLKFHLGQMTPQECIDLLVEKVGHERATAEGEVRRSFNGDYSPLYQAGYMLGALQLYALRKELVDNKEGSWKEKDFHDAVMKENMMPIELLRALLQSRKLTSEHQAEWRFYHPDEGL